MICVYAESGIQDDRGACWKKELSPSYALHSKEVSMSGVIGDIQNMRQPPGLRQGICSDTPVMLCWMTG